ALDESGQTDDTLIVLAGDNGLAVGQHGLMGKQNLYDHSVRVPLILAGPGVPKGRTSDALCYLTDLYATLCDLTGLDTPTSVEGPSFAPVLAGGEPPRSELLLAYRHLQRAVREQRWKYIEYRVDGKRTCQLFDLQEDPHEINDLAETPRGREHVQRLRPKLTRWRDELGDDTEFWDGFGEKNPEA
ncbi:MAG: sulfatase/phosphatase domain-containing protein, partial [Phycisphaerae bacterium]